MRWRSLAFSVLCSFLLLLCWSPVRAVVRLGLDDDRYVQVLAAPLICVFLLYWERKRIFKQVEWATLAGSLLLLIVCAVYFFWRPSNAADNSRLSFALLTVILGSMAAFILCYGVRSFKAAFFPLCCLLLAIPVSAAIMDRVTVALQQGSAAVSLKMLRSVGVPVFAEGTKMSLPGLEIEVAPECSGIRSCLALALIGVVAGRLFLRNGWSRLALVVSTVPIAILKNALRISVIAWLGAYVDRAVLHGPIHHYGGLIFTPLGILLFAAFLVWLGKLEKWVAMRRQSPDPIAEGRLTAYPG